MKVYDKNPAFSFAIVNLQNTQVNVTPICLWNFELTKRSYEQHQHYKVC